MKTVDRTILRRPPKVLEKIFFIFPALHLTLILISIFILITDINVFNFGFVLFVTYLLAPLLFRLLNYFYPLTEGTDFIGLNEKTGNMWIIAYHLQSTYLSFPSIERILIALPGLFSMWLRLWGSRIGKNVVWTPRVDIVDRTSLDIGDFVFVGDKTYISAHLIQRKDQRLQLLHKKVKIGNKVLIGFSTEFGPGARINENEMLPALSKAFMGRIIRGDHASLN